MRYLQFEVIWNTGKQENSFYWAANFSFG